MKNLSYRKNKIQEKRKSTPWRKFLKEIASWYSFNMYNNKGQISTYPNTDRIGGLLGKNEDLQNKMFEIDNNESFLDNVAYTR